MGNCKTERLKHGEENKYQIVTVYVSCGTFHPGLLKAQSEVLLKPKTQVSCC